MTLPIIAAQTGAVLIILQMILMLSTGLHRAKTQTAMGVGADLHLERKMRRHGNLAENAALFVAVLAIAEIIGLSAKPLTIMALVFVGARFAHALGFLSLAGSHMQNGSKLFIALRSIGAFGTAVSGLGLGGYLAYGVFL